jgi:hypothetical protein
MEPTARRRSPPPRVQGRIDQRDRRVDRAKHIVCAGRQPFDHDLRGLVPVQRQEAASLDLRRPRIHQEQGHTLTLAHTAAGPGRDQQLVGAGAVQDDGMRARQEPSGARGLGREAGVLGTAKDMRGARRERKLQLPAISSPISPSRRSADRPFRMSWPQTIAVTT